LISIYDKNHRHGTLPDLWRYAKGHKKQVGAKKTNKFIHDQHQLKLKVSARPHEEVNVAMLPLH
jgi:hypothetical protein